jgi:hypothetical protein
MVIAPLFDFILASVTDAEVGSASGVLNAGQQLAGAVGVAVMGTVFFATLSHSGYVAAIDRCLLVQLSAIPVLFVLTCLLPKTAREDAPMPANETATEMVLEQTSGSAKRVAAVA